MMNLDVTALDVLVINGKLDNGEKLTDEDRRVLAEWEKKCKQLDEQKKRKQQLAKEQERYNYTNASDKLKSKMCPLMKCNCMGEDCAWYKVVKVKQDPYSRIWEYDGLCAVNIPEHGTMIYRED